MMKKILVLICCVVAGHIAMAQKDSLAFDDHGKYIYYKVITTANTSDVLYSHAMAFFKTAYDKNTLKLVSQDAKALSFAGEGVFMVSKKLTLGKHDDGRINCKMIVEIKDSKYRYWFTDFIFTPYERDRYNNFVAQPGLDLPIEKAEKQYDKADVDHYLDVCAGFAKQTGKRLEQYMRELPQVKKDTIAKKVISINKW